MHCDECNQLLSSFMDSDLDEVRAAAVREHLAVCDPCAKICEELAAIVDLCKTEPAEELVPPNPDALWCRINNIIESEVKPQVAQPQETPRRRLWRFTFPQLASAVLCVALVSSLLTVIGIKNYFSPPSDDIASGTGESQCLFEKLMAKVGLADTPQKARERRLAQQQAAIEYWDRRVRERRAQWNAVMQEKFDKNLNIINESVNDYTRILQQNPDDEITGEMLDSAMDEKMQLLREFAEL
ncbi:MAG TPA: zf-HC2 domain-containing protein [Pyrinomonadaceae bacterium]|nr:zf-HC2 domain-containing protein [Pyrinomonadaceae bacterium]